MRTVALLVGKDLRRRFRSPLGFIVALSFPLVFAGMIALTFGSRGDRVPKIHLLVENQDQEIASNAILSALTADQMAEYVDVEVVGSEGAKRMEKGEASALLRIPKGFTQDLIDGKPTTLSVVRNPAQGILPEIAEQLSRVLVEVLDAGTRVLRGPLEQIRPYARSNGIRITDETVIGVSLAVKRAVEGADTFLFPPAIALDTASMSPKPAEGGSKDTGSFIFMVILPGVSVYALFLVGDLAMRDVLAEAVAGTLRRQLSGPIGTGTLLLGKALYTVVLSLIALVVLTLVGALVLRRGIDPAGFLFLSLSLVLAVTGTSATIYGFAKTEGRGATIASIIYLVLAFSGGSFLALEGLPGPVRAIAPISPFYWGTIGFRKLIEDAGTLPDVLPSIAVLAGLGAVLLPIGGALLKRNVQRGGLA